jgi:two-component system, NarL family, response regulator YdfI
MEIVICGENSVTRAGLAAMATTAVTRVVAQVGSLLALSNWLKTQSADLAVVELAAPSEPNIAELAQMVEALPVEESLAFLCLFDSWPDSLSGPARSRLIQLLGTGLVSLLPMTVSAHQMRDAIAAIASGLVTLHPELNETLFFSSFAPSELAFEANAMQIEALTPREIEVLNGLADGLTNRAIATALNISEHTVKFHISAILAKLNVSSRTKAVAVGIRTGLVML